VGLRSCRCSRASHPRLTLTEADGRTTLPILVQHKNQQDRDAHIQSGMEDGLQDALDLLEEGAGSLR
jgi:uncharacterized protein YndB with AHSA1/START domain